MTQGGDYISFGLEQARGAVLGLMARDNLQLQPKTMPRTRRQKASGRLKQVEIIVRRLIFLMALALKLAPVRPRTPAPEEALEDDVELAIFPRVPQRRIVLMPPAQAPAVFSPFMVHVAPVSGPPGPVSSAPLIARISALLHLLKAPETAAKRLARIIERLKAKGEPRPIAGPVASAFRLSPELGALSTALPGQINAALETWESSG